MVILATFLVTVMALAFEHGNLVWNTITTLSFYQNSTHLEPLIDMYSVLPEIFGGNNTTGPYDGIQ
jgi:hypothetical protein